ncbi:MAG: tetratricopeptide repeat protein [Acidobacteria bacterium]|nr:tetratricopeptide repeat protein [Acidobacteriota bacterium]
MALERAVAGDIGWMEAWANLGSVRLKLGDYAGAESAFRQGLEIDPHVAVLHANIGLTLLFLKRPAEAERHGREALRQAPGDARANYVTGLALLHQGKIEGVALLEKAAGGLPAAKEALKKLPPSR